MALIEVCHFDLLDLGRDFGRGPLDDDSSALEHVGLIGDFEGLLDVLFDEQDRDAAVGGRTNSVKKSSYEERGETQGEFVDQQNSRLTTERTSQGEHLLLAAGEQTHAAFQ
jgi:hypothetical protein